MHRPGRGARATGRLCRGRGAANGDQRQVHARPDRSRLQGSRARARALVHRSRRSLRAVARRAAIGFRSMRIEGSGALVAGGASGLGEATVRRLHSDGAAIVIADLNEDRGSALASELGERASFVLADVSDPDAVQEAVAAATALPGGLRISVCCAGIGWAERVAGKRGPHGLDRFETVIRVNLIGTFNVLRLAAAAMLANEPTESAERGVCINTASIAAFDGQIGQVAYSASKGGIARLTLPAARDLASR